MDQPGGESLPSSQPSSVKRECRCHFESTYSPFTSIYAFCSARHFELLVFCCFCSNPAWNDCNAPPPSPPYPTHQLRKLPWNEMWQNLQSDMRFLQGHLRQTVALCHRGLQWSVLSTSLVYEMSPLQHLSFRQINIVWCGGSFLIACVDMKATQTQEEEKTINCRLFVDLDGGAG